MAGGELLKPTLHIEVQLKFTPAFPHYSQEVCSAVTAKLIEDYDALEVGQHIDSLDGMKYQDNVSCVEIADYTGPTSSSGYHALVDVHINVQSYVLKPEREPESRRSIRQLDENELPQMRILALPNVTLHEAWRSLVFDDTLPALLLRYLVRMLGMMSHSDLNLSTFNWNRLCLLHGPPGSGKSTLCRALAQKLSIRLRDTFTNAQLIEVNTNSMLSKYFGESGKHISSMFEEIYMKCQDRRTLICVVMDEVETVAGSRERAADGSECSDGLRATNQLLTALDRLRNLPNVIVLCTSNMIDAIDPAFLDRVDIKQYIPSPSSAAIYNIFRSCLNELVRSGLVKSSTLQSPSRMLESSSTLALSEHPDVSSSPHKPKTRSKTKNTISTPQKSVGQTSPEPWRFVTASEENNIPTFEDMLAHPNTESSGERVWALAKECHGFSGRTLRRLPIMGLAMYTWGGECTLADAISALEKAVEQELAVVNRGKADVNMEGI